VKRRTFFWLFWAAAVLLCTQRASAEMLDKTFTARGSTVHYKLILPDRYDPAKTYPAVISLAGGAQTASEGAARRMRAEAEKRGYIVFAPAAPPDHLYLWVGQEIFPEFFEMALSEYKIEDNKFHIAGSSNGGIAALEIAAAYPQYFKSVTTYPGYLEEPREPKLRALSKMCVNLYVGELDDEVWRRENKREADVLASLGAAVQYVVEKGQGHGIQTLNGEGAARLFEGFEATTKGCTRS
jgi:poly(3-hydroxybutyrate) depolymerase